MPTFRITSPDGTTYNVTGPDGATEQDALNQVMQQQGSSANAQAPFANGPLKMGKERFADDLRAEVQGADWATRNIAGAGTALSNLFQRGKQIVGQGDEQAIQANRIIAEEAPVGSIAGNVALLAPTAMIPGANTMAGAATVGAIAGAVQPTLGDESTLGNVATGAAFGIGGKVLGDAAAKGLRGILSKRITELAAKKSRNAPIDQTLREGIDAGFSVPPSMRGSGMTMRAAEGVAGPARTAGLFASKNQELTDSLARRAVGLPDDVPLTSEVMQGVRKAAYQRGYVPVANMGKVAADADYAKALDSVAKQYTGAAGSFKEAFPDEIGKLVKSFRVGKFDAGDALQASQALRDQANAAFRRGDTGFAKGAKSVAKALEDQIERTLSYKANAGSAWNAIDDVLGKRMSGADFDMLKGARLIVGRLKDGKLSQDQAIQNLQQFFAQGQPTSKTARAAVEKAAKLIMESSNEKEMAAQALKGFRDARQLMAKAHTIEDAIVEGGGSVNAAKLAQRLQSGKPLTGELKTIAQMANNFPGIMRLPKKGDATPISGIEGLFMGGAALPTGGATLAIPAARTAIRYGLRSPSAQRMMGERNYTPNALLRLLESGSNNELVRRMLPGVVASEAVGSP